MFDRIRAFFQKVFKVGKAVQDVSTAAGSVQDVGTKRNFRDVAGSVVQAAGDINTAGGSVEDATK